MHRHSTYVLKAVIEVPAICPPGPYTQLPKFTIVMHSLRQSNFMCISGNFLYAGHRRTYTGNVWFEPRKSLPQISGVRLHVSLRYVVDWRA